MVVCWHHRTTDLQPGLYATASDNFSHMALIALGWNCLEQLKRSTLIFFFLDETTLPVFNEYLMALTHKSGLKMWLCHHIQSEWGFSPSVGTKWRKASKIICDYLWELGWKVFRRTQGIKLRTYKKEMLQRIKMKTCQTWVYVWFVRWTLTTRKRSLSF